jgi:hypothetical protein
VPAPSAVAIALHACARYFIVLLLLAGVAFAPLLYLAAKVPVPGNLDQMNGALRTPWVLAAMGWVFQLAVVGAAAPLVHGLARGKPLSQMAAPWAAVVGFARGVFPVGLALAAVLVGLLALVVPGLALLGLFSLSAAVAATSPGVALPAQLLESARLVRRAPVPVALVVGALLVFDLAAVVVAKSVLVTGAIGKVPTPAQLAGAAKVAAAAVAAMLFVTPLAACGLAAIHARRAS